MANEFLEDLQWRGLVAQCTDLAALEARLAKGPITLYAGFDPTAVSLHVGNLIPLIALARFRRAGHRALALVGGATGLVGDPSGKSTERVLQTPEQVAERAELVRRQLTHFLQAGPAQATLGAPHIGFSDFIVAPATGELGSGDFTIEGWLPAPSKVVNNLDWTAQVSFLDFLRDIGKHFSVNAMIHRDSVKSRLDREGEGISFTEFSYMLLQAFDFLKLAEREGCELQIGGSDQWGNMVSGADLIRRKLGREAFALTFPLLTMADGQKFGKTAKGAVWVDAQLTSVWEFYQFWLNAEDQDVIRLLKLFTFVTRPEIEDYIIEVETAPQQRMAQRRLAFEMTAMTHGNAAAREMQNATAVLFGKGDVASLSPATWASLAQSVPSVRLAADEPLPTVAHLLVSLGLEPSTSKALALIKGGGVSVNGVPVTDPRQSLTPAQLCHGQFGLVRKGKKHLAIVQLG